MDLASVPEIGATFAAKLQQAGVENAEALAGWEDLAGLSASSGVDESRLESFRDAARERLERVLADAGVADPADLAEANMGELKEKTGLAESYLERYQKAARAHVKKQLESAGYGDMASIAAIESLEDAVMKTGISAAHLARYRDEARAAQEDRATWKVVLVDGAPVARVTLSGVTHDAVPLLTASATDDEEAILSRATGDAVLLKPALDAVPVVIGGARYSDVQLYKERRKPDGEVEEIRVRVAEVREVGEPAKKKGGIGRLFRRGS